MTVGRLLEQQLALVFVQDDPFEHLFRLSPAPPVEPAPLNYTAPVSDSSSGEMGHRRTLPTTPKRRSGEPSVAAALVALTERMDRMDSRAPKVEGPSMFDPTPGLEDAKCCIVARDFAEKRAYVHIVNLAGAPLTLQAGSCIGSATPAQVVDADRRQSDEHECHDEWNAVISAKGRPANLNPEQQNRLIEVLNIQGHIRVLGETLWPSARHRSRHRDG